MAIQYHSPKSYPTDFPCADPGNYFMQLDMGLIRTEGSAAALTEQRRSYNNLPTTLNLSFVMGVAQLLAWTLWVNDNAGYWVDIPLAHPFMAAGVKVEMVPVRFISSSLRKSYAPFNRVSVSIQAELCPSVFAESTLP
jgi:hypothetical protein